MGNKIIKEKVVITYEGNGNPRGEIYSPFMKMIGEYKDEEDTFPLTDAERAATIVLLEQNLNFALTHNKNNYYTMLEDGYSIIIEYKYVSALLNAESDC